MPAATLLRLVLVEARRGGLPWLAGSSIVVCAALAAFLSELALTESRALQIAIVAATLRACAVFLITAYVAASTLREIQDKGLELMLALPLSRTLHYVGRLAGHATCGVALALAFCVPLMLWAPAGLLSWGASLACELALMAAIALFFSMTLAQPVPAIAASLGLYFLARVTPAIQLIAAGPLVEASLAQEAARICVDVVAALLPNLEAVTRTEWLLYGPPALHAYMGVIASLALYGALALSAGLVDFHRRSV